MLWHALLRGTLLGFVGGIPVGPVNAAVIDTALRKCFVRAVAVGVGGAFMDFLFSQLAMTGITAFLSRDAGLRNVLLGVGGVALILFGLFTASSPPVETEVAPPRRVAGRALLGAVGTGALTTAANPAAIVSWVLVAGTLLADLTRWEGFVAGVGIFGGTAVWFFLIAYLATRGRVRLGPRARWITRTVGALLVLYGVFLVGKASMVVWAFATPVK